MLANETVIMSSDDNSITLTSHRLLQQDTLGRKEIMLTDVVACEVKRKKSIYFLVLFVLFGCAALMLTLQAVNKTGYFSPTSSNDVYVVLTAAWLLTIVAGIYWQTEGKKILLISGGLSKIAFSIGDLKKNDLNKFIDRLVAERDKRRSEGNYH